MVRNHRLILRGWHFAICTLSHGLKCLAVSVNWPRRIDIAATGCRRLIGMPVSALTNAENRGALPRSGGTAAHEHRSKHGFTEG